MSGSSCRKQCLYFPSRGWEYIWIFIACVPAFRASPSLWHVWVIWDIILPLCLFCWRMKEETNPGSELPTCFSYLFPGSLMTSFGKRMCFCRHKIWLCWPERLGDTMHALTSKNARRLQAGTFASCTMQTHCLLHRCALWHPGEENFTNIIWFILSGYTSSWWKS